MMHLQEGGRWWLTVITAFVFWIALVAGVVALVMFALRRSKPHASTQPSTLQPILEVCFARADISEELSERLRSPARAIADDIVPRTRVVQRSFISGVDPRCMTTTQPRDAANARCLGTED